MEMVKVAEKTNIQRNRTFKSMVLNFWGVDQAWGRGPSKMGHDWVLAMILKVIIYISAIFYMILGGWGAPKRYNTVDSA